MVVCQSNLKRQIATMKKTAANPSRTRRRCNWEFWKGKARKNWHRSRFEGVSIRANIKLQISGEVDEDG